MPVHFLGISGGRLWHTIRRDDTGWEAWDDVLASAPLVVLPFPFPEIGIPAPSRVACAVVTGRLHVCVTIPPTRTTSALLLHTIRFGPRNWQPWGNASAAGFPSVLGMVNVDCVGIGPELHVCIDGFRRLQPLQTLPAVWHSIRTDAGWSAPTAVTSRYPVIWDHACGDVGGALHVVVRCISVPGTELLMHTIRFPNGTLQAQGDQDVIGLFPATVKAAIRRTGTVAVAGGQGQLHVVASDGSELFHTIRLNNTSWLPTFGPVRPAVTPGFTSPLTQPACASADGNLHIFAIDNSSRRVWHTIRLSTGAWRNPETATTGSFGDVLAAVPAGFAEAAPRSVSGFDVIAAAGA